MPQECHTGPWAESPIIHWFMLSYIPILDAVLVLRHSLERLGLIDSSTESSSRLCASHPL